MSDILRKCYVNKFIPKKTFYDKIGVTSSIRNIFINDIEKITWMYKLSEDTTGISKTENVEEIEIFDIVIKTKNISENVFKVITKLIPYKILFKINYKSNFYYLVCINNNVYKTEWNEEINFNFNGINLENIFNNIAKLIIKEENSSNDFEEIINNKEQKDKMIKEINVLENKVRSEKQFNRKVELNNELNNLKQELEELNNE